MRSRLGADAVLVEDLVERAPAERLAHVIGLPVVDPAGVVLGVVVGRIVSSTTIDLLVRRRQLFHRSQYLRLQGQAMTRRGAALVYQPAPSQERVRLEVLIGAGAGQSAGGAA